MGDPIFNDNVLYMKSLIGKTVQIQTVDDNFHEGAVYVIDPAYKTVVLLKKDSTNNLELILYHAIKTFDVLSDVLQKNILEFFTNTNCNNQHSEDVSEKKAKLIKWFKHMFINVREEDEMLKVEDHVTIYAPFDKENCICDNTIVLERICNIIDLMPPEFK